MSHASCQHEAYRLTCADFDELCARACGKCEICQTPEQDTTRRRLVIDHDGRYGFATVRGLLCDKCNARMRLVDGGRRTADPAVVRYYLNAWFVKRYVATPPRPRDGA
jgi:Recombination endonuclease VII